MTGLADLEQALLVVARDALKACHRPVPDTHRYHGEIAVSCCDDPGLLTIHWNPVTMETGGLPPGTGIPVGKRTADLILRLYRCWPTIDAVGNFDQAAADQASEGLARDLDCVLTALGGAICAGSLNAYLEGIDGLELLNASPRRPSGGCAGIEWKLRAHWKPWAG